MLNKYPLWKYLLVLSTLLLAVLCGAQLYAPTRHCRLPDKAVTADDDKTGVEH